MDVVFIVDTTGSMGGAICNVKLAIAALIDQIACVSGDDFQLGLLTFKDHVEVLDDLAPDNRDSVEQHVRALFASGGANGPEASDEALSTAVNGLDEADRDPGQQIGDFDGTFRPDAVKVVVLITDAPPGGFDDWFTPGVDDVNAHARAVEAAAASIKISAVFVPTSGDYMGQVAIMQDYAVTTGGLYLETAPDGAGTAAAIDQIVLSCGGSCGDAIVDPGEVCDDGNQNDDDGCDQYCRETVICPVLPADSCVASLENCTWPPTPELTVQACTYDVIGAGDGCDCGCGFPDPDCEDAGCTEPGCTAPECDACTDVCRRLTPCPSDPTCPAPPAYDPSSTPLNSPPPGWICSPSWYASGDVCDCHCGAPDPDCLSSQTSGGVVCDPACGNGRCDLEEFPSTCPEDCAPVPPFTAFPPACGLEG
jgi:cysteine-rich repeat protein